MVKLMTQYIDKSALVAEIEKELNITKKYSTEYVNGKKYALNKILSYLDTLDVLTLDDIKEMENQAFLAGVEAERNKSILKNNDSNRKNI